MPHPGRPKDVVVYSDGTVVEVPERYSGKDELRFRHCDDEGFNHFVAGIPPPTPWERSRNFVVQFVALVVLVEASARLVAPVAGSANFQTSRWPVTRRNFDKVYRTPRSLNLGSGGADDGL